MGPATEAFEELSKAAGAANCAQWQAEADAADRDREHKVEAMDIYDIHSKPREYMYLCPPSFREMVLRVLQCRHERTSKHP